MIDAQLLDSIPLTGINQWKLAQFLEDEFREAKEPLKICDRCIHVDELEQALKHNEKLIRKYLSLYANFVAEYRHHNAVGAIEVLLQEYSIALQPWQRKLFRRFSSEYRARKRDKDSVGNTLGLLRKKRVELEADRPLTHQEAKDHDPFGRYQYWQEALGLNQVLIHQLNTHRITLMAMNPQSYSSFLWKSLGGYYD